ncbi:hypothetical protein [Burkholderia pseudomallei]
MSGEKTPTRRVLAVLLVFRWLPVRWRTPRLCLWLLSHGPLPIDPCLPPLAWAQRCVQRGDAVIRRRGRRATEPGDLQARSVYGSAVALGYYDLADVASPRTLQPVADSTWTREQLERLRQIGIGHGAALREYAGDYFYD